MIKVYWNCRSFAWFSTFKIHLSWLFQVMEAEQARTRSEAEHKKTAANYNSCISHMRQLEKKLKRSINKSRSVPLIPFWMLPFLFPLLGPRCVRKGGYVYVIWCSPDVSCVGCAVLGCALFVRAKECDCTQRSVILPAVFSSDSWQSVSLPLAQFFLFFSPCRPYFELKAKYYLQLEVCMFAGCLIIVLTIKG